jgi:hypothetical protein
MKVVAAYLLALLGGNASPSAKDIEAILGSGNCRRRDLGLGFLSFHCLVAVMILGWWNGWAFNGVRI